MMKQRQVLFCLYWWMCLSVIWKTVEGFTSTKVSLRPPVPIAVTTNHKSLTLAVFPPSVPWMVAHVIGGASGTPIVVKATRPENGWYRKIDLPSWTPPDKLFAPVWTTLYALMGFSMSQIVRLPSSTTRTVALTTWTVHMVLNLAWAPAFFGFQWLRVAQALNISLLFTLGSLILPTFFRLNPLSAYLLLPYTAWLTFATFLNGAICRRNPTRGGYNDAKFQAQLAMLQEKAKIYAGL